MLAESLKLLGLTLDARVAEVRARYYELAATAHPDHGGSVDQFHALNKAFKEAWEWAWNAPCTACEGKGHTYLGTTLMWCSSCQHTGLREGRRH
jgi:DnaJ-class molecular chaperone